MNEVWKRCIYRSKITRWTLAEKQAEEQIFGIITEADKQRKIADAQVMSKYDHAKFAQNARAWQLIFFNLKAGARCIWECLCCRVKRRVKRGGASKKTSTLAKLRKLCKRCGRILRKAGCGIF